MNSPLVSIIIPVYNGANFVGQAIDSALAQTYPNIEIIVVNDGSNDSGATEKIVLSYGDKVRYFKKENGGVSTALNLGINNMKGEYFSWLSHDDLYVPEKIENQVCAIESENDIILCSGYLMDECKNIMPYKPKMISAKCNGRELFGKFLHGYLLNGLGFLIPKKVFDDVGLFDTTMRYLQDLDLWLRIMHHNYGFVCQNKMLVATRIHKKQFTNTAPELFNSDMKKLAQKHVSILDEEHSRYEIELLVMYLFFFAKERNVEGLNIAKDQLKLKEGYNFSVFIKTIPFVITGRVKQVTRMIYGVVLRLKRLRG